MAAAAVSTAHHLHDPFSPHHTTHFSPTETSSLLDLLAVDNLIDSTRGVVLPDTKLLNDLLAVDLEFDRADFRGHKNVATAPELKDEKDLLLDLLGTDMEVDGAKGMGSAVYTCAEGGEEQHHATTKALYDPYARKGHNAIEEFTGMYGHAANGGEDRQLRDNVVMMHLLATDEQFDDTKRYQKLIESDDYAIIAELFDVDKDVSGAKRRALLVEDLQGLLDVDHLVDGTKMAEVVDGGGSGSGGGGKRSIFSVKEKYKAKVAVESSAR